MERGLIKFLIKEILTIIAIFLLGCIAIIFSELYFQTFSGENFSGIKPIISSLTIGLISVFTVLFIAFFHSKIEIAHKLFFIAVLFIAITSIILYLLKINGFWNKIKSIEDLRSYISSLGTGGILVFILLQFLQVVVLPIPSLITVGAGVLLFGPFKCAIYSCIGIIFGSICAFYIGKFFGKKVVIWLVGEKTLNKLLVSIDEKYKMILTLMFLFPFFPDDVLCFVAGISFVETPFFLVMIFITRIITIFTSCYSINNSLIPYNTWWGIVLWIIFFILTFFITRFVYKNSEKVKKLFNSKKHCK